MEEIVGAQDAKKSANPKKRPLLASRFGASLGPKVAKRGRLPMTFYLR
jgi:hypothetical protein